MNFVALVGRLTKDPVITYRDNGASITKFSVAVDRKFKNAEGKYDADFLNVVLFGKTAEFAEKWFRKGDPIAITGRIQTGSYEKQDGTKVYTTDIIGDTAEFVPSKPVKTEASAPVSAENDFMKVPEGFESGLPF